jgi:hypothetical protein
MDIVAFYLQSSNVYDYNDYMHIDTVNGKIPPVI